MVFLFLLCLFIGFPDPFSYAKDPLPAEKEKGKMIMVAGDVLIGGQKAVVNQLVESGVEIVTGKDSTCEIVFQEKNIIKIYENSKVVLDINSEKKNVNVLLGSIANIVNKLQQAISRKEDGYMVKTPTAVAGIRGTVFFVKVDEEGNTYFCNCYGKTDVWDANRDNKVTLEAYNHKCIRISKSGDKTVMAKDKLLYHSSESMNAVAEKINEQIEWKTSSDLETYKDKSP